MTFITKRHLSRRTFLRGTGVTLALPADEAVAEVVTGLERAGADVVDGRFLLDPDGVPVELATRP